MSRQVGRKIGQLLGLSRYLVHRLRAVFIYYLPTNYLDAFLGKGRIPILRLGSSFPTLTKQIIFYLFSKIEFFSLIFENYIIFWIIYYNTIVI
jgi:hypothetical protein